MSGHLTDGTTCDDVTLAQLGAGDRRLLRGWLLRPDLRGWWGSMGRAEAAVSLALDTPSAICRMISSGGQPIGYAQAIDAGISTPDARAGDPSGVWECMLFIASDAHRGRGFGRRALESLTDEVFGTTLAPGCVLRLAVRSEPAVRAVEAAGFTWSRVENDPDLGPVWVMRLARPPR